MTASLRRYFRHGAFTLIELLVATVVLSLILMVMLSLITQTSNVWRSSSARIEAFQGARRGFENLTRLLEQATLNTYWDYDNPNQPTNYIRKSELHFLVAPPGTNGLPGTPGTGQTVFFQAPANTTGLTNYDGLTSLINACGFYVQYGSDAAWLPAHVNSSQARERFRLMQWTQDTETLGVYNSPNGSAWITASAASQAIPVADNVIALLVWPKEEGTPAVPILNAYSYDSRSDVRPSAINQLPPVLQVGLVAIDEISASRLGSTLPTVIGQCLNGLFTDNPSGQFSQDLETLQARLTGQSITYRSFVSAVPMREAKWSP